MFWALVERHSLVSLSDMILKLSGHEVAYAYGYLANAAAISADKPESAPVNSDDQVTLKEALNLIESACQRLELDSSLDQIPRARATLNAAKTYGDVREQLNALRLRMHDELKRRLFLFVPPAEAKFYSRKQAGICLPA